MIALWDEVATSVRETVTGRPAAAGGVTPRVTVRRRSDVEASGGDWRQVSRTKRVAAPEAPARLTAPS
jgi:hypothetical protein